ncbi:MAG TPA: 50S ribosomal protein L29 [Bacteroidota bacterium]
MGQLQNPMKMGQIRKDIARMRTILRQRELEQPQQAVTTTTEKAN